MTKVVPQSPWTTTQRVELRFGSPSRCAFLSTDCSGCRQSNSEFTLGHLLAVKASPIPGGKRSRSFMNRPGSWARCATSSWRAALSIYYNPGQTFSDFPLR